MYALMGVLVILFNRRISNFFYNLVFMYTNKMNLRDVFIFKIDRNNEDAFYKVARCFTITIGLIIFAVSVFFIYFLGLNVLF